VPVVATYLESLEPLRDVLMIDDWRAGIDAYLFDPHAADDHLARAQSILLSSSASRQSAGNGTWFSAVPRRVVGARLILAAGRSDGLDDPV